MLPLVIKSIEKLIFDSWFKIKKSRMFEWMTLKVEGIVPSSLIISIIKILEEKFLRKFFEIGRMISPRSESPYSQDLN